MCPNCGFGAGAGTPPPAPVAPVAPLSPPPAAPAQGGWAATPQMSAPPPAPATQKTSGKAIASLVLGIIATCLAVYLGILLGIVGLILGILGMKEVNRSNGAVTGKGLAIAGIILSSIGIVVQLVIVIFFSAIIAAGLGGDWDEIQRCAEDPDAEGCEEYQAHADDDAHGGLLAGVRDAAFRLGAAPLGPLAPGHARAS